MGMLIMSKAAELMSMTREPCSKRLARTLERHGLEIVCPYGADELLGAVLADKKRSGDQITLVIVVRQMQVQPSTDDIAYTGARLNEVMRMDIRIPPSRLSVPSHSSSRMPTETLYASTRGIPTVISLNTLSDIWQRAIAYRLGQIIEDASHTVRIDSHKSPAIILRFCTTAGKAAQRSDFCCRSPRHCAMTCHSKGAGVCLNGPCHP